MSPLMPSAEIMPKAIQVAICLCAHKNSFLLLLRNPEKPLGLTWCAPGGKVASLEPPEHAALRELEEETGLKGSAQDLSSLGSYMMSYEGGVYQLHLFLISLDTRDLEISLSYNEHIAFTWADLSLAESFDLIPGGFQILEIGTNYIKGSSPESS